MPQTERGKTVSARETIRDSTKVNRNKSDEQNDASQGCQVAARWGTIKKQWFDGRRRCVFNARRRQGTGNNQRLHNVVACGRFRTDEHGVAWITGTIRFVMTRGFFFVFRFTRVGQYAVEAEPRRKCQRHLRQHAQHELHTHHKPILSRSKIRVNLNPARYMSETGGRHAGRLSEVAANPAPYYSPLTVHKSLCPPRPVPGLRVQSPMLQKSEFGSGFRSWSG